MAKKKQFKAESKRLLDLMINSIYTHKEIFLRELVSNASDAIDKYYYESQGHADASQFEIRIEPNKEARTLTISDTGIGISKEELEENLGTIAKSGSLAFKEEMKKKEENNDEDVDIIGQFGVGFYSAFMVAKDVRVITKKAGSDEAYEWVSAGEDGYEITPCTKETNGTTIILTLKEDTDEEKYSQYLETYELKELINKYRINENATIINIKRPIKIIQKRFNGITVNDYEISYRSDICNEKFFNGKYALKDLYESEIYKKSSFNELRNKIKKDNVSISKLFLNNGVL